MPHDSRFFSQKQRQAAYMLTGENGVADHIVPFSAGGDTSTGNMQLISAEMNAKKGANVYVPRKWQEEFQARLDELAHDKRDFVLNVCPGAGKTRAALHAASKWKHRGHDRKIIIVVPSTNLAQQWQDEAAGMFGLQLQNKEVSAALKAGFDGCVITYQFLVTNYEIINFICCRNDSMVILDEAHHTSDSDNSAWGDCVIHAFHRARLRLSLTGTAWRTDKTRIPFMSYDDSGVVLADYTYGYKQALLDGLVRYVHFQCSSGKITNELTQETIDCTETMSPSAAAGVLGRLFASHGTYADDELRRANGKLMELRAGGDANAGGLVVCIDQEHARAMQAKLQRITGLKAPIVTSDEPGAHETIKTFRKSSAPWLVSVKMVSEGTDIRRLRVLCWLTNTTTSVFFYQVVGRVMRRIGTQDLTGYVFLPAHPGLMALAESLKNDIAQAIAEQREKEEREPVAASTSIPQPQFWTNEHAGEERAIIGFPGVSPEHFATIEQALQQGIPLEHATAMVRIMESNQKLGATRVHTQTQEAKPLEQEMDDVRKDITDAAGRLAKRRCPQGTPSQLGDAIKAIHADYRRLTNKPGQSLMSLSDLQHKLSWIRSQLRGA